MPVRPAGATEVTNRASWWVTPSFSPPVACRVEISAAVTSVGTPSTNSRTLNGSGRVPSNAWLARSLSIKCA